MTFFAPESRSALAQASGPTSARWSLAARSRGIDADGAAQRDSFRASCDGISKVHPQRPRDIVFSSYRPINHHIA